MSAHDEAFRAFVDARWPALVRFAWTLTGDRGTAEDVVQTALLKVWRRWRSVRSGSAEAYVRAAVVNTVISRARRRRVLETVWPSSRAPEPASGGDLAEEHAVADAVWAELSRLPARMRAVVVLRFLEDLSEAATADLLGCSVGTVKTQTNRAMTRLRERAALRDLVGASDPQEDR